MSIVYNQDFRDAAANASYPFTADSTMQAGELLVSSQVFLDCLLYPLNNTVPPFRISALSGLGEADALQVTILDSRGRQVSIAVCHTDADSGFCYDTRGRLVGTLVYDIDELTKLRDQLIGHTVVVNSKGLVFAAGVCYRLQPEGWLYVESTEGSLTGSTRIVGSRGIHFSVNPDDANAVRVNLYGEEPLTNQPILQIDVVSTSGAVCNPDAPNYLDFSLQAENIWIAAHPDAAVRVATSDKISIGKLRDFDRG